MPRYESHITVDRQHAEEVKRVSYLMGWTFSVITGCPILGQGSYCYLTGFDTNGRKLRTRVQETADLLTNRGIEPLRLKIERIVWDTKTGVDEIGGAEQCESRFVDHPETRCNLTKGHKGKHERDETRWTDEMSAQAWEAQA